MAKLSRREVEQELEQVFGFSPDFYRALPDEAVGAAWGLQRDFQLPETQLSNKTKELIGLAMAAHIKCRYCIYFHTSAARVFGATDEEMREAIAMGGLTVMFSNNLTGMQVPLESFMEEVDRALEYVTSAQREAAPPPERQRPRGRA